MCVRLYFEYQIRALYAELGAKLSHWAWVEPMRLSWPLVNFGRAVEGLPPMPNPYPRMP